MKRLNWCGAVVLLLTCWGSSSAQQSSVPSPQDTQATSIIVPFFQALQNGDVQTIKQYLSPSLYEQYRVLLEQNSEYPAFLRKHYKGAKLRVEKIAKVRGQTQVQATIDFPAGMTGESKILLRENNAKLQIHTFQEE